MNIFPGVTGHFACPCCGRGVAAPVLVTALRGLVDITGCEYLMTSGYRCKRHNAEVGGSPMSKHMLALAVDLWSKDIPPVQIALAALEIAAFNHGGIGIYPTHCHLDVRPGKARWAYYPDRKTMLPFGLALEYYTKKGA